MNNFFIHYSNKIQQKGSYELFAKNYHPVPKIKKPRNAELSKCHYKTDLFNHCVIVIIVFIAQYNLIGTFREF